MSDEILLKMNKQLGHLTGVLETSIDAQKETNDRVAALLEKQDGRIDKVEGNQNKAIGFALGAGTASGGVAGTIFVAISKMLGGS